MKSNFKNKTLLIILMVMRFTLALGLGIFPLMIGLKNEWYAIPLVCFNFLIQLGLALIDINSYLKKSSLKWFK